MVSVTVIVKSKPNRLLFCFDKGDENKKLPL